MVLIAAWGVFLVGPAQTYGVSVFVDPMLAEFGWSRSLISSAYAIATLVGAVGVILTGRLLSSAKKKSPSGAIESPQMMA